MAKFTYRPMLRSKAGEATALTQLDGTAKARLTPVFHLVLNPPDGFSDAIGAAWAAKPMGLDGTWQSAIVGSATGFMHLFDRVGKAKVNVIPSVDYNADPTYLAAVQKLKGMYAPGLIVKAKPNQLQHITQWVVAQGWNPAEVDLIVYLTEIGGYDPDMLEPMVTQAIKNFIPNPSPWRSITISASAAPKDHSDLAPGRNNVPRLEWTVWNAIAKSAPYQIDFADYASSHPDLTDPPGYVMGKATVSVRYAIDNYWIMLKGKPTTGKTGQPMRAQYLAHAKTLAKDPAFGGLVVGCWADDRIKQFAGGAPGGGSRSVWAGLAANRHLSLVADRLP